MEIELFYKVFKNKYLFCKIFQYVRAKRFSYLHFEYYCQLNQHLSYDAVHSVDWMLENAHFELLLDKIRAKKYLSFSSSSHELVFGVCRDEANEHHASVLAKLCREVRPDFSRMFGPIVESGNQLAFKMFILHSGLVKRKSKQAKTLALHAVRYSNVEALRAMVEGRWVSRINIDALVFHGVFISRECSDYLVKASLVRDFTKSSKKRHILLRNYTEYILQLNPKLVATILTRFVFTPSAFDLEFKPTNRDSLVNYFMIHFTRKSKSRRSDFESMFLACPDHFTNEDLNHHFYMEFDFLHMGPYLVSESIRSGFSKMKLKYQLTRDKEMTTSDVSSMMSSPNFINGHAMVSLAFKYCRIELLDFALEMSSISPGLFTPFPPHHPPMKRSKKVSAERADQFLGKVVSEWTSINSRLGVTEGNMALYIVGCPNIQPKYLEDIHERIRRDPTIIVPRNWVTEAVHYKSKTSLSLYFQVRGTEEWNTIEPTLWKRVSDDDLDMVHFLTKEFQVPWTLEHITKLAKDKSTIQIHNYLLSSHFSAGFHLPSYKKSIKHQNLELAQAQWAIASEKERQDAIKDLSEAMKLQKPSSPSPSCNRQQYILSKDPNELDLLEFYQIDRLVNYLSENEDAIHSIHRTNLFTRLGQHGDQRLIDRIIRLPTTSISDIKLLIKSSVERGHCDLVKYYLANKTTASLLLEDLSSFINISLQNNHTDLFKLFLVNTPEEVIEKIHFKKIYKQFSSILKLNV